MAREHRILFVSGIPLTPSAQSFMDRSSIAVETSETLLLDELPDHDCDLIVLDEARAHLPLAEIIHRVAAARCKLLVISSDVPESSILEQTEGFIISPYSQTELISAIGEVLGTEIRRALRLGVSLPTKVVHQSGKVSDATMLQISENGCLFEVDTPARVGDSVALTFVLPSNQEELSINGTIVSGNELQLLYGLRFDNIPENERLAVLVFVELGLAAGEAEGPGRTQRASL